METVAQRTKKIIADTLGVDPRLLTYDTDLKNDMGADSLDILETITLLESEFGVTISDGKIEGMKRVGDLIKYFEKTKFIEFYPRQLQMA